MAAPPLPEGATLDPPPLPEGATLAGAADDSEAAPRNPLTSPAVRTFPPLALVQRLMQGSAIQRSLDVFMKDAKEGVGPTDQNPFGFSPETEKAWRDAGILPMPGRPSMLRTANDVVLKPAAMLGDAAMRLANGVIYGAGGVLGQIGKETGLDQSDRLRDETINFLNYLMIESGRGGHVVKTERAPDGTLRDVKIGTIATPEDFANAATVIGGENAPPHVEGKLRLLYDQHGIHPAEVVHEAERDPTIAQALLSDNRELPPGYVGETKGEEAAPPPAGEATRSPELQAQYETWAAENRERLEGLDEAQKAAATLRENPLPKGWELSPDHTASSGYAIYDQNDNIVARGATPTDALAQGYEAADRAAGESRGAGEPVGAADANDANAPTAADGGVQGHVETAPRRDPAAQAEVERETAATAGLKTVEKDGRVFVDTRGEGVQYHGSSEPNVDPSSDHYSTKNYYGQGFYTTDAADVAYGYSRRGAKQTGERNLYQVEETRPLKIFDGEAPLPAELEGALREGAKTDSELDGIIHDALDEKPKNLRELYDNIREIGTGEDFSADTIQEIFDAVNHALRTLGYDGFSHEGGLRTKTPPHKVTIYFNPEADIRLTKRSFDEAAPSARVPHETVPETPPPPAEPRSYKDFVAEYPKHEPTRLTTDDPRIRRVGDTLDEITEAAKTDAPGLYPKLEAIRKELSADNQNVDIAKLVDELERAVDFAEQNGMDTGRIGKLADDLSDIVDDPTTQRYFYESRRDRDYDYYKQTFDAVINPQPGTHGATWSPEERLRIAKDAAVTSIDHAERMAWADAYQVLKEQADRKAGETVPHETPPGPRPYARVPDSLMGFRTRGPNVSFEDSNYPHAQHVRVTLQNGEVFDDAVRGMNQAHAVERAYRNWDAKHVQPIPEPAGEGSSAALLEHPYYSREEVARIRAGTETQARYIAKQRGYSAARTEAYVKGAMEGAFLSDKAIVARAQEYSVKAHAAAYEDGGFSSSGFAADRARLADWDNTVGKLPQAVVDDVLAILKRIAPQTADVGFMLGRDVRITAEHAASHGIKGSTEGHMVAGETFGSGLFTSIRLAVDFNPASAAWRAAWTARHEAIHALRRMRLFSDEEWAALHKAAVDEDWLVKFNKPDTAAGREEAIAEAFAAWGTRDKAAASANYSSIIEKVFGKIADFYQSVKDALAGQGVTRWEQVFADVETGKVGERPIVSRAGAAEDAASLVPRGAGGPPALPPEPPGGGGAGGEPARLTGPDTLAAARQKILDKINIGGLDPTRAVTWSRLYTGMLNRLFPIEQAVTHTVGKDVLPVGEDAGKLAQLLSGAAGKADHFINFGTFDFHTYENTGPSLKAILAPMHDDLDGLRAFMASVRVLELKTRGIKTGFDAPAARQVAEAGLARYGETMAKLVGYQNEVSRFLKDSGVLSERGYAAMLQANRLYVPFSRIMEIEGGNANFSKGTLQARNPIKHIKGSERDIIDPLETIIRNTYLYTQLAEKNTVGLKLVDMLKEAGLGDEQTRPLVPVAEWDRAHVTDVPGEAPPPPERVSGLLEQPAERLPEVIDKATDQALTHYLERQGVDSPDELLALMRSAALPAAGDEIVVFRDGKRERYRVDSDIARAMKGLDADSTNFLLKILAPLTNTLRAGAVLTPDFALRHTFRDWIYAVLTSPGGFSPVHMVRGFGGLIFKDADYQAWLKGGGGNISMVALDRRYLQTNLEKLTVDAGLMTRAWNVVVDPNSSLAQKVGAVGGLPGRAAGKYLLHPLQMLTEFAENASHLGAFKKSMRQQEAASGAARLGAEPGTAVALPGETAPGGPTKEQIQTAAFVSRDTAVDAARRGAWTRGYNMITAFANITMQDTDRIARAFINKPVATSFKVAAGIMLPSALLWWYNHDDPRYQEIPEWQKQIFWIFPTDKWVDAGPAAQFGPPAPGVPERDQDGRRQINQGIMWRLPKPFGAGVIFGTGTEKLLEAFVAHNPDAFHRFGQAIMDTVIPQFVPSTGAPILDQFANRSIFTNHTLIPSGLEKLLPEYQYTPYTTELAKALGQIISAFPGIKQERTDQDSPMMGGAARALSSPILIENYIRGWSGTLGIYALTIADAGLRKMGVLPDPVMPAWTLADLPIIKAFTVRYPTATAQSIQDFYDRYSENKTYYDTWLAKAKEGDGLAMERIQAAGGEQIFVRLDGIKTVLTEHSQLIRDIVKNTEATSDEKRQLVDSLYYSMIVVGRSGKAILQQIDLALPRP